MDLDHCVVKPQHLIRFKFMQIDLVRKKKHLLDKQIMLKP